MSDAREATWFKFKRSCRWHRVVYKALVTETACGCYMYWLSGQFLGYGKSDPPREECCKRCLKAMDKEES